MLRRCYNYYLYYHTTIEGKKNNFNHMSLKLVILNAVRAERFRGTFKYKSIRHREPCGITARRFS